MDTYTLQHIIAAHGGLSSTEKLVGLVLALHLSKKSGEVRVKQQTIARKCGLGERAVRNAMKRLIENGIFSRKRTFRVDVLGLGETLESVCMERIRGRGVKNDPQDKEALSESGIPQPAPRAGCKRQLVPVARRKKRGSFFDLDTTHSTPAEEKYKRPLVQNG